MEVDAERWIELVASISLKGPAKELASHAAFVGFSDNLLKLALPETDDHLRSPMLVKQLADALSMQLGSVPQIRFEAVPHAGDTLHQRNERQRDARQTAAEATFMADPDVQRLMQHGAKVVPDSIRPFDE